MEKKTKRAEGRKDIKGEEGKERDVRGKGWKVEK